MITPGSVEDTVRLTRIACQIARHTDNTQVRGVHWKPVFHELAHGDKVVKNTAKVFDKAAHALVQEMSTAFYAETGDAEFPCEWVSYADEHELNNQAMVEHARCCDLIISPGPVNGDLPDALITRLLLEGGRPLLIIPHEQTVPMDLDTALIAWNSTRESSRAAFDGLPLLKQVSNTQVLWIEEQDNPDQIVEFLIKEFAAAMSAHLIGAQVQRSRITAEIGLPVSSVILQSALDVNAGLVVFGARGADGSLGVTTRELIQASTIPLLIAH